MRTSQLALKPLKLNQGRFNKNQKFGCMKNHYWIMGGNVNLGRALHWNDIPELMTPGPHNRGKWHPTLSDVVELGPFPDSVIQELNSNWALTDRGLDELPPFYGRIKAHHFSGCYIAQRHIADVFEQYSNGECQILKLDNLYSVKDNVPVTVEYFVVNVYQARKFLDIDRSPVKKITNPEIKQRYASQGNANYEFFFDPSVVEDVHIWRDYHTSNWFCDDVFKDALDAVLPEMCYFTPMLAENAV